uniref:DUF202 domain-containing protein n=1 Tax=Entomoneis paludosa TaxID=265537 RepID=A0A7S2VAF4_9STRA|mmetsp:Transcript_13666/g.28234  ORF Transcript_13666/g.28234 Transcript_13666/m.28234 type:complete len:162 (+) Transcript_13666:152-637(+)
MMLNQTSPLLLRKDFEYITSNARNNNHESGKALDRQESKGHENYPRPGFSIMVKSSSARDHLANERTYLAWVRTGLALLGASIGLLKWEDISSVTAYIVALLGLVVLAVSTRRYFRVMHQLLEDKFEPNTSEALLVVGMALFAIGATFILHETGQLNVPHN